MRETSIRTQYELLCIWCLISTMLLYLTPQSMTLPLNQHWQMKTWLKAAEYCQLIYVYSPVPGVSMAVSQSVPLFSSQVTDQGVSHFKDCLIRKILPVLWNSRSLKIPHMHHKNPWITSFTWQVLKTFNRNCRSQLNELYETQ